MIQTMKNWWTEMDFKFFKVPKAFLFEPEYQKMSSDAKLLYGALLDRMSLSEVNHRVDKDGRNYVNYSNKSLCKEFGWSHDKATAKLKELERAGLIERYKQKLGHPDKIYVLPFTIGCEKVALRSAENQDYGVQEIRTTECEISATNNTNINNTKYNKIHLSIIDEDVDKMRNLIKENIEYEILSERKDSDLLKQIVELMVDVCCGTSATITIGGNAYTRERVVERYLSLEARHIVYVMESLSHTTSDIHNIRAYLMAALYHAPTTIDAYWNQRARHDMPQLATG